MRKFIINVNGNSYEVEVEEIGTTPTYKPVVESPTPEKLQEPVVKKVEKKEVSVSEGQEVITAPMPGNIWKINVNEGDMVKSGDVLLILEAMKMENEILAPRDGKVASITTSTGAAVGTGDRLIIID